MLRAVLIGLGTAAIAGVAVVAVFLIMLVVCLPLAWVAMLFWNFLAGTLSWCILSYWQVYAILILLAIIGSLFSHSSGKSTSRED